MIRIPSLYREELAALPQSWRRDLLASVVVFLVALPLCMGIAIASGVPPAAGLVTGHRGRSRRGASHGGGSPLQVSGPAAGLAVIVWELVQVARRRRPRLDRADRRRRSRLDRRVSAGVGQWFRAVSPAVIHGMLAGIGVLIFASQFHVMVDDAPRGNGLENLMAIPEAIYKGRPARGRLGPLPRRDDRTADARRDDRLASGSRPGASRSCQRRSQRS